jgi:hypothetical protein
MALPRFDGQNDVLSDTWLRCSLYIAECIPRWQQVRILLVELAAAFSDPGYEARRQAVEEPVRTGRRGTPIEEIVPDWDERVAAAGRRRAGGCATGLSSRAPH